MESIREELQSLSNICDMTIRESVTHIKENMVKYDHVLKDDDIANMCRSHLKVLIVAIESNYEMEVQHATYKDINLIDIVFYYRWFLRNMIHNNVLL